MNVLLIEKWPVKWDLVGDRGLHSESIDMWLEYLVLPNLLTISAHCRDVLKTCRGMTTKAHISRVHPFLMPQLSRWWARHILWPPAYSFRNRRSFSPFSSHPLELRIPISG
jgi:hypothetical protein